MSPKLLLADMVQRSEYGTGHQVYVIIELGDYVWDASIRYVLYTDLITAQTLVEKIANEVEHEPYTWDDDPLSFRWMYGPEDGPGFILELVEIESPTLAQVAS